MADILLETLAKEMRKWGAGTVRRQLERMVNQEVIELCDAQKIWFEVFGGVLVAVKDRSLARWRPRLRDLFLISVSFFALTFLLLRLFLR